MKSAAGPDAALEFAVGVFPVNGFSIAPKARHDAVLFVLSLTGERAKLSGLG